MREFIKMPKGLAAEISAQLHVATVNVWRATQFICNSKLAQEIRAYALAHGGRLVRESEIPSCSTEHVDGVIVQRFGSNVVLRVHTDTGFASISCDGEVVDFVNEVTVKRWANLCAKAQCLAQGEPSRA